MANVNRVFGFRPVKHMNGNPWNGMANKYYVQAADATAIYLGDMVDLDGSSDTDGVPSVTKPAASATNTILLGPVVGFSIDPTNLNTPQYRTASTARYVWVADDPNLVFEAQGDASIAAADIGLNAEFSDAGGSTTTGLSGQEVEVSTKATGAALPLKIMGLMPRVDNATGADAKLLVKINSHRFGNIVAGV